jgi:riboflavin synthase
MMFTGIIGEVGAVRSTSDTGSGRRLSIQASDTLDALAVGNSVAVAGVCLTVVALGPGHFDVEAVPETLERSTLGALGAGDAVNLERPLVASGRFDGHVVQGHVDSVAIVRSLEGEGESTRMWLDLAPQHLRYVIEKGSVALDGVSLTVSGLDDHGFEVVLIPHTLQATTFGALAVGDRVNVEVDVLAKYIERLLEARR